MLRSLLFLFFLLLSFQSLALDFGIDRLHEDDVQAKLKNKRLAVLTHAAGVNKSGAHLIDELYSTYQLIKIFAPEHGLRTLNDEWVDDGVDENTGLPVISLYKNGSRAPAPKDLMDIDAIVVDLQDVGLRYYTYFSTIAEIMKVAAQTKVEMIILDRPNLLGGHVIEGKLLDSNLSGNFISYHTVPTRHGMTLGELALMLNQEMGLGTKLQIITAKDWKRETLLDQFDRSWIAPSPALTTLEQVKYYALWGSLEHFNLAVGRGINNDQAFRVLGAPWITKSEAHILAQTLNKLGFATVRFSFVEWDVTRDLYKGQHAYGVKLDLLGDLPVTDEFTYKVSSVLQKLFSDRLVFSKNAARFYGSESLVKGLQQGHSWTEFEANIRLENQSFQIRRLPFLLYK